MKDPEISHNVLSSDLVNCFDRLRQELSWQKMLHGGKPVTRLVAIQSEFYKDHPYIYSIGGKPGETYYPLYRHPTDHFIQPTGFTPTVKEILDEIRERFDRTINHVKIQLYPDGNSFISPHSDKVLDIKNGSNIINLSLGATRTMQITNKETGTTKDYPLKNNSVIVLPWETNLQTLHGVKRDTRPNRLKSPDELLHDGSRISMVFRTIDTFYNANSNEVIGQGSQFQSLICTPEIAKIWSNPLT